MKFAGTILHARFRVAPCHPEVIRGILHPSANRLDPSGYLGMTVPLVFITLMLGCTRQQIAPTSVDEPFRLGTDKSSPYAKGDGTSDDTKAIQDAMNEMASKGGGTVSLPPGRYLINGHLSVPSSVTLQGSWQSVPAHAGVRDKGQAKPTDDGTTLLITADAGKEDASPAITLNSNSTLRGVVIFYPNQTATDVPTPYPYTVAMRGNNPAIVDCELLNPYNGIDTSGSSRHLIRNIQGQPLRRGIYVDAIYDIGRIENVHFNPWYSMSPKLFQWQMDNAEAFIFGRADWEYVLDTFCFGYKIGYRFIKTKAGVCNGNLLGIGADDCQTSLQVDDSAIYGLLITNGEFVSFHGPDPTMIRVSETNSGVVRFVNCAYWGPCNQIAVIDGKGTVGFSDCTFVQWGGKEKTRPAIQAHDGTVMIQNSTFREDRPQIQLDASVKRALITGNVFTGETRINNKSSNAVIANNVSDRK